jgi:phosphoribosylformylglycinamidine (FGAM) synthase-like amidotransferase family enzyme
MLSGNQIKEILQLVKEVENASYSVAVEHCEGYSYKDMAEAKKNLEKSNSDLVRYLCGLKD